MKHTNSHAVQVSTKGLYCFTCREWKEGDLYRCQFCEKTTPSQDWKDNKCPKCKREYDAILAQEGDD